MNHILTTVLGVEDVALTWAVNNAPGLLVFILFAWFIWWGRGKLFEYQSTFVAVEHRIERVEIRLDAVEARLDRVETRLDRVEIRLDRVEVRLERIEVQLHEMNLKLTALTSALLASGKIAPSPLIVTLPPATQM